LKDFKETAEKEDYWGAVKDQFIALQGQMMHDKQKDLIKNRDQVKGLLEEEIASRYYYQNGRLEASLKDDPEVIKAIEVLNNQEEYYKSLNASK
jgi:carboxyl-terminal processing protease